MRFHATHLLADIFFEVVEGVEVSGFGCGGSHFFGQAGFQFVFTHFQQAAVGVVDDDEFLGVEQMMGDDERANGVPGGDATGVADHVRVARAESEAMLEENSGVHAGEHRHVAFGADGEIAQGEIGGEGFVGF